jgi:hypothetical protein
MSKNIGVDFDDLFADSSAPVPVKESVKAKEIAVPAKKTVIPKTLNTATIGKKKGGKDIEAISSSIELINKRKRNRKIFNGENTLSIKLDTNNVEFIANIREDLLALGLDEESYNRSTLGRAFLNIIEKSLAEGKITMEDIVTAYIQ